MGLESLRDQFLLKICHLFSCGFPSKLLSFPHKPSVRNMPPLFCRYLELLKQSMQIFLRSDSSIVSQASAWMNLKRLNEQAQLYIHVLKRLISRTLKCDRIKLVTQDFHDFLVEAPSGMPQACFGFFGEHITVYAPWAYVVAQQLHASLHFCR